MDFVNPLKSAPASLVAVFVLVVVVLARQLSKTRHQKPLPPGPRGLPIIGNMHQAPVQDPWRTYQQWSKEYGHIFSLQYGLNTIIMLGTHQACRDLLEKRSNIYSSRPRVVMGGECVSKGNRTLLLPYGNQWRNHHRLHAAFLNTRQSQNYRGLQDVESKQLVFEMLSTSDFSTQYHRYASSLIFALAYGKRMSRGDEPELDGIDRVMENFLYAARVGTWIVDALPALNYLPKFLAPWKKYGDELHDFEANLYEGFLDSGEKTLSWNWSKQAQTLKEASLMPRRELAYNIGEVYEAGSDTTTMALEVFTMAMVLTPDVASCAQKELDSVVGHDRLPRFDDDLPYVNAIMKEVLRWRPVSAGGIPHAVIQDDEYEGYHIPKGATVIGNHWAIHLDENVYADPYAFRPDRWIENPDLPLSPFGFGRRVCPGQHVARNSLFINIARLLWAFNIEQAVEIRNGIKVRQEIDPMAMTQGFNSRPTPFKAQFRVRSQHHADVVNTEWRTAEKDIDTILAQD